MDRDMQMKACFFGRIS